MIHRHYWNKTRVKFTVPNTFHYFFCSSFFFRTRPLTSYDRLRVSNPHPHAFNSVLGERYTYSIRRNGEKIGYCHCCCYRLAERTLIFILSHYSYFLLPLYVHNIVIVWFLFSSCNSKITKVKPHKAHFELLFFLALLHVSHTIFSYREFMGIYSKRQWQWENQIQFRLFSSIWGAVFTHPEIEKKNLFIRYRNSNQLVRLTCQSMHTIHKRGLMGNRSDLMFALWHDASR